MGFYPQLCHMLPAQRKQAGVFSDMDTNPISLISLTAGV